MMTLIEGRRTAGRYAKLPGEIEIELRGLGKKQDVWKKGERSESKSPKSVLR